MVEQGEITSSFETEWRTRVYLPLIRTYQHLIADYAAACSNPDLLEYFVSTMPMDSRLNWNYLSQNKGLTIEIVRNHVECNWCWQIVSSNSGVTMQDIVNHPEYPWNWYGVSRNPNMNISMFTQYPNKNWYWYSVSGNPGITMQDVISHPEYPWNWYYGVSDNPNLTMNMIKQYPEKTWNWNIVSRNPGITMQDIINNPQYNPVDIESKNGWQWNYVFGNEFKQEKQLYVNNQLGRVLLVSMLDEYDNDTSTHLDPTLLVLYNDYHLSFILSYL